MKLLINTASTFKGGGVQVAKSFIEECKDMPGVSCQRGHSTFQARRYNKHISSFDTAQEAKEAYERCVPDKKAKPKPRRHCRRSSRRRTRRRASSKSWRRRKRATAAASPKQAISARCIMSARWKPTAASLTAPERRSSPSISRSARGRSSADGTSRSHE